MNTSRAVCFALFCMLFLGLGTAAMAQQQAPRPDNEPMRQMTDRLAYSGPNRAGVSQETTATHSQRLPNEVTTQSAQLLALAHKLNADLDKSNANELSVAVVKDAAEIEKLAKSIRKNAHDLHKLQKK